MRHMPGLNDEKIFARNTTGAAIELPEIGGYSLAAGAEVELTDEALPLGHYGDSGACRRAIYELPGTVLYQQRLTGALVFRFEQIPPGND